MTAMVKKTIYCGRFASTPTPSDVVIRFGAVLVVGDDGIGVIEDVDWEVKSAAEAQDKFGQEVEIVTATEDGFFFPGFIGKDLPLFPSILPQDTSKFSDSLLVMHLKDP